MSLYTCSYPKEIQEYINFFKEHDIEFTFINKNPDVENTIYGYYEDKPYFNVLFEDKAGFDAKNDWGDVLMYFLNKEGWLITEKGLYFHLFNDNRYGIPKGKSISYIECINLIIENM